jgi:membrane protein required for beta-lactamase induction
MTFIEILIALLIERFFDWSHLRQWQWFPRYEQMISEKLSNQSASVLMAAVVIPLLLAVWLVNAVAGHLLFGFVGLLFNLLVLLYCLGPRNLWADGFASINTLIHGDSYAADNVKTSLNMSDTSYSHAQRKAFLSMIFNQANSRVFAIVFWFALLGPVGAVMYRVITLAASAAGSASLVKAARQSLDILDWLPVRLLTFLFALGGHFVQVLTIWRKNVMLGAASNEALLEECGHAALGGDEQKLGQDGALERNAINLLDRSFVIMLVVMLVLVFVN